MTNPPETGPPPCGEPGHASGCDVPWGPPLTEADYAAMRADIQKIEAGWRAQEAAREAENDRLELEADRNEAEADL